MRVKESGATQIREEFFEDVPSYKDQIPEEAQEFVKNELDWIANWIREKYSHLHYGVIRALLHELLDLTV